MEVLQNKVVKTRKKHNCWGCAKEFPTGSKLTYTVSVDGGDFADAYWCDVCDEFMAGLEWYELEDIHYGGLLDYDEYPK